MALAVVEAPNMNPKQLDILTGEPSSVRVSHGAGSSPRPDPAGNGRRSPRSPRRKPHREKPHREMVRSLTATSYIQIASIVGGMMRRQVSLPPLQARAARTFPLPDAVSPAGESEGSSPSRSPRSLAKKGAASASRRRIIAGPGCHYASDLRRIRQPGKQAEGSMEEAPGELCSPTDLSSGDEQKAVEHSEIFLPQLSQALSDASGPRRKAYRQEKFKPLLPPIQSDFERLQAIIMGRVKLETEASFTANTPGEVLRRAAELLDDAPRAGQELEAYEARAVNEVMQEVPPPPRLPSKDTPAMVVANSAENSPVATSAVSDTNSAAGKNQVRQSIERMPSKLRRSSSSPRNRRSKLRTKVDIDPLTGRKYRNELDVKFQSALQGPEFAECPVLNSGDFVHGSDGQRLGTPQKAGRPTLHVPQAQDSQKLDCSQPNLETSPQHHQLHQQHRRRSASSIGTQDGSVENGGTRRRVHIQNPQDGQEGNERRLADLIVSFLKAKFGSFRKAFKAMDRDSDGLVHLADLEACLQSQKVSVGEITGCHNLGLIFNAFDVAGTGSINLSDFIGHSEEAQAEHDEWQFLNTMEKWTRWCDMTEDNKSREPHWKAAGDMNSVKMQERRDREQTHMRKAISQGLHRTPGGLQMTAWHLPKRLDAESVRKYRLESLEKVTRKSKRIQQALSDTAKPRHELAHCVQALADVDARARKAELAKQMGNFGPKGETTSGPTGAPRKTMVEEDMSLSMQVVNDFTEEQLSADEKITRNLARSLGMQIPDVEAIQAQYKTFDKDGTGLVRDEFSKLIRSLSGRRRGDLSEAQAGELYRTIDTDGDGRVSFEEYLVWHQSNWYAPMLSMARPAHVGDARKKEERRTSRQRTAEMT